MSFLRSILAGDLGEKNIPKNLVQAVAPTQLASLYWREEASQPPKTIVEIWALATNKFIVVSGNFANGEWMQDDVQVVGETYDTVSAAQTAAKSTFSFGPIEENEIVKEQVDTPAQKKEEPEAPAAAPAETEQKVASSSRRLIKKK